MIKLSYIGDIAYSDYILEHVVIRQVNKTTKLNEKDLNTCMASTPCIDMFDIY